MLCPHRFAGATLVCGVRASPCGGPLVAELRLQARGLSHCGSRTLEHRLDCCGSWAPLLRGMGNLPESGIEPVSTALAGQFSSTAPLGKSYSWFLMLCIQLHGLGVDCSLPCPLLVSRENVDDSSLVRLLPRIIV